MPLHAVEIIDWCNACIQSHNPGALEHLDNSPISMCGVALDPSALLDLHLLFAGFQVTQLGPNFKGWEGVIVLMAAFGLPPHVSQSIACLAHRSFCRQSSSG